MRLRRGYTRREFLARAAGAAAAGTVAGAIPGLTRARAAGPARSGFLAAGERRTLDAAVARIVPAEGPGDWSAADVGAGDYVERLLAGTGDLYAGGPYRPRFQRFQPLWRAKELGWEAEVRRLRELYRAGLAELDRRAGGDFAGAAPAIQDQVLTALDLEGSPFFAALYAHTMEGVYAHPVYGGNRGYRAWRDLCYQGDVHGVRFPERGSRGAWNEYGGYAPEEMAEPGRCPEEGSP